MNVGGTPDEGKEPRGVDGGGGDPKRTQKERDLGKKGLGRRVGCISQNVKKGPQRLQRNT